MKYPSKYRPSNGTSPTYWNHVRQVHPEVFKKRSEQSREVGKEGAKLARYKGKRIFLDELPPDARGRPMDTMKIDDLIAALDREEYALPEGFDLWGEDKNDL